MFGREYRSLITAGKTTRYEIVVVEIARPSTAVKYLFALPVSWNASTITIVENTPERMFTTTGVPQRAEKYPNERGAAPSKPATACERSAPMIHVVPLDSRARMKPIAARSPSTLPAPLNVAPSLVTSPP